ncbi:MAG: Crp/Fnr family transcriptional regulator [Armatimonadetes bacterium]|nr:Crp/Fnr family transcriptional regulator [Armatimonadota bacterium]
MPSSTYYLRSLGLLQGLPEGAARAIDQRTSVRTFERRQVIFSQGVPADTVYLLVEGTAELSRVDGSRETILLVLTPGELVGELTVSESAVYPVQARALNGCVVCAIGRRELAELVHAYPPLAWHLLTWASRNMAQAYGRIHDLASCEVPDKLLALIRHLAVRHGVPTPEGVLITLRFTQQELAALIGSCREAVSRGLKSLRDRGLISMNSRHITLRAPV